MADVRQLAELAWARTDRVRDTPQGRFALRERFYQKYSFSHLGHDGFGNSEIAFLRWELRRGVLNRLDSAHQPGSPWWRDVNLSFIYDAEFAAMIHEADLPAETPGIPHATRQWLRYLEHPTGKTWYRAHNTSIIQGYLTHAKVCRDLESPAEQAFINMVLYRLLFAQAMEEDASIFGDLGEFLADPEFPAVDVIVAMPSFYPRHYPLTPEDVKHIQHKGYRLEDIAERLLDMVLILPELTKLYVHAAVWNETPQIVSLIDKGKPVYPDEAALLARTQPRPEPTARTEVERRRDKPASPDA